MKYLIPVLCAVALFAGCMKPVEAPDVVDVPKEVDGDQLEVRVGRAYFEEKPFTGVAVWKHENGQKRQEQNWKDGELDGLATRWHENGQKKNEYTYKDGKVVSMKEWDEDGIGRVVWERTKPPTTNTK